MAGTSETCRVSEEGPGQQAVVGHGGADDRRTSIGGSGHDGDHGRSGPGRTRTDSALWIWWRQDHGLWMRCRAGQRRRAVPKMLRVISRPRAVPAERSADFTAEFPSTDSTIVG